jgi:hypothetical protein
VPISHSTLAREVTQELQLTQAEQHRLQVIAVRFWRIERRLADNRMGHALQMWR